MNILLRAERSASVSRTTRIVLGCAAFITFAAFARDTEESVHAFALPTVTSSSSTPMVTGSSATPTQHLVQPVFPTAEVLAPTASIGSAKIPGAPVGVPATTLTRIKSGLASWYGSVLDGHRTASGRRFDMNELTAAHRDLPFGSKVKVTNLRNHRSVVVTITDRGILYDERIIDLSYEAARQLKMIQSGVDPVSLDLITTAKAPASLR
jgi:rare lipoprotein A